MLYHAQRKKKLKYLSINQIPSKIQFFHCSVEDGLREQRDSREDWLEATVVVQEEAEGNEFN